MYISLAKKYFLILAICTGDCSNGGTCVAPETCDCQDGWSGNSCSDGQVHCEHHNSYNNFVHHADVDECGEGVCTNCTNIVGSFQCTCPDGNTLTPGLTCVGEL